MAQGILIAIEGIDGSGKTTQARLLGHQIRETFPSARVCETADPAGSPLAQRVREIITTMKVSEFSTLMLIAGARSENYRTTIEPALARGDIVITDRWLMSSLVYQCSYRRLARACHRLGCDGVEAGITFVLDVPVEVARGRLAMRGELDIMEDVAASLMQSRREAFSAACEGTDAIIKIS